jgi:hypothetical protein
MIIKTIFPEKYGYSPLNSKNNQHRQPSRRKRETTNGTNLHFNCEASSTGRTLSLLQLRITKVYQVD